MVDGFATAEECEALFREAEAELETSTTVGKDGKPVELPFGRRSRQHTLLPRKWSELSRSIVERMDATSMQPFENGQHLTVTDYGVGDEYELHVDSNFQVGRVATALLFLAQPEEGGELVFPWARLSQQALAQRPPGVHGTGRPVQELFTATSVPSMASIGACERDGEAAGGGEKQPNAAVRIEPRVGRLVVFFSHDPQGRTLRPRTLHGSCPVKVGRKSIAQRFYQWHALHSENRLGGLLEQVEKANGKTWFVDWREEESQG